MDSQCESALRQANSSVFTASRRGQKRTAGGLSRRRRSDFAYPCITHYLPLIEGIFSLGQSSLTDLGFARLLKTVDTRTLAMFSYIDSFRLPLARSDGILSGSTRDSCCLVGWHNGPVQAPMKIALLLAGEPIIASLFVALDPAVKKRISASRRLRQAMLPAAKGLANLT